MRIKITAGNKEKIDAAIKAAEGRARERLITYDMIVSEINHIHETLQVRYYKDLEGTRVKVAPHVGRFPRAYKYTPQGTYVRLIYDKGSWFLTRVDRYNCAAGKKYEFDFSEATKKALLDYAACLYC